MIRKIAHIVLATLFLSLGLAPIAGCNTVEGIGKDLQRGGQEIREEAREQRR